MAIAKRMRIEFRVGRLSLAPTVSLAKSNFRMRLQDSRLSKPLSTCALDDHESISLTDDNQPSIADDDCAVARSPVELRVIQRRLREGSSVEQLDVVSLMRLHSLLTVHSTDCDDISAATITGTRSDHRNRPALRCHSDTAVRYAQFAKRSVEPCLPSSTGSVIESAPAQCALVLEADRSPRSQRTARSVSRAIFSSIGSPSSSAPRLPRNDQASGRSDA